MSYTLESKCWKCRLHEKCNDSSVLSGAINGIHMLQSGHMGAGEVELKCSNFVLKEEAPDA